MELFVLFGKTIGMNPVGEVRNWLKKVMTLLKPNLIKLQTSEAWYSILMKAAYQENADGAKNLTRPGG